MTEPKQGLGHRLRWYRDGSGVISEVIIIIEKLLLMIIDMKPYNNYIYHLLYALSSFL